MDACQLLSIFRRSFANLAKAFRVCVSRPIAHDSRQLHGGSGHLSKDGTRKIVRDLRAHRIREGTNEIMRLIVARGLTEVVR